LDGWSIWKSRLRKIKTQRKKPGLDIALEPPFVWLVVVLTVGIFVQSTAGFAAGLLVIPSMLWAGFSIPEAQASLIIATIPQNLWGVWSFRDAAEPRRFVWPGIGRLLFLPVGVASLTYLESFSIVTLRQMVGGTVLLATLITISVHPTPRDHVAAHWGWLAFPLSGFFQGLVGMGGPPMVLWVQAHDWDTRQSRVFLFTMYLISIIPALVVLLIFFGDRIVPVSLATLTVIPWLLGVTWLGLKTGTAMGVKRLRRGTYGLLILTGIAGIAAPWIG
jgi:uncharacterized membrane protein YfcA